MTDVFNIQIQKTNGLPALVLYLDEEQCVGGISLITWGFREFLK